LAAEMKMGAGRGVVSVGWMERGREDEPRTTRVRVAAKGPWMGR
jgi:hypothetical protein